MKHKKKSRVRLIARALRWLDRRREASNYRLIARHEWQMFMDNAAHRDSCYWNQHAWNG